MDDARTPPHDEAAEMSVLGTVLLTASQALPLLSSLRVDDFFDTCHREAWAAVLAVAERRMPVDVLSVGDELRARGMWQRFENGWQTWASAAAQHGTAPERAAAHAKLVQQKATLRRLIALCAEVQGAAYGAQDVEDVLARARDGVAALEVAGLESAPVRLRDCLGEALDVVEARTAGKRVLAVDTGIEAIDTILGGMKPQNLHIVAGRPGQGKTAFAECVALKVAKRGTPVLFFSLEMARQELIERDLSIESRLEAFKIGSGGLDVDGWKAVQGAGNRLYEVPLWYDDRSTSLGKIAAEIYRWHAREVRGKKENPEGLALVVLDYLQLAEVDRESRSENREQQVARIGRRLKSIAKELKIVVVAVCQLSRAIEKRGGRPLLSDLRESGAIEQDADVVLFPWRDIPADDVAAQRQSGPGEGIIGKHRGGPTGIAHLHWNAPLMEWSSLDQHSEPPREWQDR